MDAHCTALPTIFDLSDVFPPSSNGRGERDQVPCSISLSDYPLKLRSAFGTSHSLTDRRVNALITLCVGSRIVGYGEVGLPPKKPGCYEADLDDVRNYFIGFVSHLRSYLSPGLDYEPKHISSPSSIKMVRRLDGMLRFSAHSASLFFSSFLHTLDTCPLNSEKWSKAPRSGLECAVLDAICQQNHIPLHDLISSSLHWPAAPGSSSLRTINVPTPKPSFYSVGLNPDLDAMLSTARFGLDNTCFLKIKMDSDVERAEFIFNRLFELVLAEQNEKKQAAQKKSIWCIDANASWSPEVAAQFLPLLKKMNSNELGIHFKIVEQPFPLSFLKEEEASTPEIRASWSEIKRSYNESGILIFGDESMCTAEDVETLKPYVDGVNVKLEKCAGFREAVRAIEAARAASLEIWIGCMVGSRLNSTAVSHLMPLADYVDADGSLLVAEESHLFTGGFQWGSDDKYGLCVLPDDAKSGLGMEPKQ